MHSNNKRIARNTLYLYLRKILSLIISLYTSRILLQALGIDDFGLFGLVGSIVVLFSSLRSLFASSIQRFLNIQTSSDLKEQNEIFSMGVLIHIGLSILFLVVVEIAGIFMIPELNLHPEKVSVAIWVLQFSILAAILSILTVPYDAVMMAKERFGFIALLQLFESILKVGVIFLLYISPINRLIFYVILLVALAFLIRFISAIYCHKNFPEIAKFHFLKNRKLLIQMTHFAGWNFFGNLGYSLTNQGLNFILNWFGGVVANAARTIAYQVNDNIRNFVIDASIAFTPQSMQAFYTDKTRFYSLQFLSSKICSSIFLILIFPIYVYTKPILIYWLGESPQYTVQFIHGIIVYSIIRNWHGPIDIAFKSANMMKKYQLAEILIMVLNLPVAWIFLHYNLPLYMVFYTMAIMEVVNLICILILAKIQLHFPVLEFCNKVIAPTVFIVIILYCLFIGNSFLDYNEDNFFYLISGCLIAVMISSGLNFLIMYSSMERKKILSTIFK